MTTTKDEASAVTTAKIVIAVTSAKALNLGRRNKIINGQYLVGTLGQHHLLPLVVQITMRYTHWIVGSYYQMVMT